MQHQAQLAWPCERARPNRSAEGTKACTISHNMFSNATPNTRRFYTQDRGSYAHTLKIEPKNAQLQNGLFDVPRFSESQIEFFRLVSPRFVAFSTFRDFQKAFNFAAFRDFQKAKPRSSGLFRRVL